jgi:hypothetical protein
MKPMKQVATLLVFLCLVLGVQAQAPTFKSGVDYNDYIVGLQTKIGLAIVEFNGVMGGEDVTRESIEPYYQAMLTAAKEAQSKTKALGAYKGNTELRDSAVDLFTFYVNCFTEEYKEMIDLVIGAEITEATLERVNEILVSVTAEEGGLDQAFQTAQSNFAKQFGFSLEENELQDAIDGN